MGKKDRQLLTKLAEKEYNKAVVALATKGNEWIKKTLESMPEKLVDNIYSDNPERRALIKPYTETDEEAIKDGKVSHMKALDLPLRHMFL